jgi:hypothetical protein
MNGDVPSDSGRRSREGVDAALSPEERAQERALDAFMQRTDWSAWSAAAAPSGFAQRVLEEQGRLSGSGSAHQHEPGRSAWRRAKVVASSASAARPRRLPGSPGATVLARVGLGRVGLAGVVLSGMLLAGVLLVMLSDALSGVEPLQARGASEGRRRAEVRTELAIGGRAVAVLEAGAELSWQGDRVEQQRGDVFYRVNPGSEFRVHTPDGTIEVLGTCFGVDIAERGALLPGTLLPGTLLPGTLLPGTLLPGTLARETLPPETHVAVYEGRVQVSAASEDAQLRAGESARLNADGVEVSASRAALDPLDRAATPGAPSGPAPGAASAPGVEALRRQLAQIEEQKRALEDGLRAAEATLRRQHSIAAPRNEFDLTPEDWKVLAVQGTVKFRVPCSTPDWRIEPEKLDALGLAPDDAGPLEAAYARSRERLWAVLRPLCAETLGSEKVPELLGRSACISGILAASRQSDLAAANEAMRQVAEIRAGLRAAPDPTLAEHPVLRSLLALTGEPARFEAELAEAFGPEEAKRLAFSEELCRTELHFAGPGPRKVPGD